MELDDSASRRLEFALNSWWKDPRFHVGQYECAADLEKMTVSDFASGQLVGKLDRVENQEPLLGIVWHFRPVRDSTALPSVYNKKHSLILEAAYLQRIDAFKIHRDGPKRIELRRMLETSADGVVNQVQRLKAFMRVPDDVLWEIEIGAPNSGDWAPCYRRTIGYLEAAFQNQISVHFECGGKVFEADLTDHGAMTQLNTSNRKLRRLRREYVTKDPMLPPRYWIVAHMTQPYGLADLSPNSHHYQRAVQAFVKTETQRKVFKVEIYQNVHLWAQYQVEKQSFATRNAQANERWVFHGARFDQVNSIFNQGFLRDAGIRQGFGAGTYFDLDAAEAIKHATPAPDGSLRVFYTQILVGDSGIGQGNSKIATKTNGTLFDSMVNSLQNPTIFVLSAGGDHRAYPEFVLHVR